MTAKSAVSIEKVCSALLSAVASKSFQRAVDDLISFWIFVSILLMFSRFLWSSSPSLDSLDLRIACLFLAFSYSSDSAMSASAYVVILAVKSWCVYMLLSCLENVLFAVSLLLIGEYDQISDSLS